MSEFALYRKYRSQNFASVIGQDHIVKTLQAALSAGQVRHAYLFTGPRGVGKTSVARLLARAINCTGDPKPCGTCPSCQTAINSSLDIVEMDAASNRSIDSVRDLREKINLAPTASKFKVYIIDEVHMLTSEAFNALLKTLEEPPAHAVFILATTEAHKLPETIVSRTQSFKFKPIGQADLVAHLKHIASSESITIEDDAVDAIARAARGGFRDAISLLDQIASSGISPVTLATVMEILGYSGHEQIAKLCQAMQASDAAAALTITSELVSAGAQPTIIATQASETWRTALLAATGAVPAPDAITKQLATTPVPRIITITKLLLEVLSSPWPALSLDAAVAGACVSSTSPEPTAPTRRAAAKPTASTAPAAPAAPAAANPEAEAPAAAGEAISAALWPKVLARVKAENNSLAALLQMYPADFGADEITIKPRFNFHRDLFAKAANRQVIEAAAQRVYGRPVKVSARTEETAKPGRAARPNPNSELITSALEILGGEVVD